MRKTLLIPLIALLGLGLLCYPFVANYISQKNGSYAAETYAQQVAETDEEAIQAAWDEAVKYNENLSGSPAHDPFIEGSGMVMQDNYYQVLNIDDTMGYISIPVISVKLPLYHGTADSTLHRGVGHLEGSSMPVGGKDTHCVLTGHTGLSSAKMFTDLIELKEGDTFYLHILNETLAYQIDRIEVVEPNDTKDLKRVADRDYCTLVTCTPYGVNSQRLLVRGVRVAYSPEQEQQAAAAAGRSWTREEKTLLVVAGSTACVMLALVILTAILTRRKAKREMRLEKLRQEIGRW